MKWDEWRGSLDGRPTFWLKRLLFLFGCRVDLHKFIGADDPGCFHSHPSWAIRIVLWGGYTEEVFENGEPGMLVTWLPGEVGIIRPEFTHRIRSLVNGRVSYSLWLRGPIIAPIYLLGTGWPKEAQGSISTQGGQT